MVSDYIAVIHRQDFEPFRRILGTHLSNTYDEWKQLHNQKVADSAGRRAQVVLVEVYPDEFATYLTANGDAANMHLLENFAYAKGTKKTK
jgi:hypothetical protein